MSRAVQNGEQGTGNRERFFPDSCSLPPDPCSLSRAGEWAVGVFAQAGTQWPRPCLQRCLGGDPQAGATRGCPMVRWLCQVREQGTDFGELNRAGNREQGAAEDHAPPAVCSQGYAVSLVPPEQPGQPHVLVMRPDFGKLSRATDAGEPSPTALVALRAMAVENWSLSQESQGLASELLRSYEQINLIFDVSAQIATLSDASQVRRTLLGKLRHLFDADDVFYVSEDGRLAKRVSRDGRIHRGWAGGAQEALPQNRPVGASARLPSTGSGPDFGELPPEFPLVIQRLRQSRRVLVSSPDGSHDETGHGTSLWGPLVEGDSGFAVVGVIRRGLPFLAGDMLLLDSALTYGSHILSNLRLLDQLKRTSFEAVRALVNAIDQKDNYTCGHSERVGFLARATGQHLGLPANQLQALEWAGLLHDVGKIGIPERVLNKPGALSPEEFALIREHPSRSYEVLQPVASLEPILEGVLYHHESPDGSGYPRGLRGQEIPLTARIIHVVDVFDALTSTRSYREPYSVEKALEIMGRDAGQRLDAQVVESFLVCWAQLPQTHPEQYQRFFGHLVSAEGETRGGEEAQALVEGTP